MQSLCSKTGKGLYPGNCPECRLVRVRRPGDCDSICSVCCAGWAENRRRGRRGGGQARRSGEAGRADHQEGGAGPPGRERGEAGLDPGGSRDRQTSPAPPVPPACQRPGASAGEGRLLRRVAFRALVTEPGREGLPGGVGRTPASRDLRGISTRPGC